MGCRSHYCFVDKCSCQQPCSILSDDMSSPTKLRKALKEAQGGEALENSDEQEGSFGGRESPLDNFKDTGGAQTLPAFLSEERIKSIMLGIVPCSNHDMGAAYKSTMRKLGMQQV